MTEDNTRHKVVVVIGGGYAGTPAANHLRMRPDVDITLVNSRPTFEGRIRREARKPGSLIWPKGGPRPEQPAGAALVVASS